jgi:3-mercaptopyruvate sulfurtransferase SseA
MANVKILISMFILILIVSACSPVSQSRPPTQRPFVLPQTDADVPRVGVADAKTAFDKGQAVILDVRSADSFAAGHISGAISMPLNLIESDPTKLPFDKNQWIITYCT